ncbi:hypothetical protein I3842_08G043600 [Carya illinoinensis]|uniref:Uncharacterized protein n=1 Tax=Carya illinoinensis TaxID=32201 RepID=A0A922JAE7_CARIL|nr:hypothetical protein I3842_08G043600 [Carya illinoinensis]
MRYLTLVISNPEIKRTLATLRKAEFGFLGVIVEKLKDKSPLLPLYRTVHEIFTSYGSSFNSFKEKKRKRHAFHTIPQTHVYAPCNAITMHNKIIQQT